MYSIVMPYYKNIKVIERSVKSVLNQTFENFELLIVDDGSNDDVEDILKVIGDQRIRYIKQDNRGVSAARNKAIHKSIGEWICFLDSDDEWLPHHLEELTRLQNYYNDADIYLTSHERKGSKVFLSNALLEHTPDEVVIINDLLKYSLRKPGIIHTNSICIRKSLIEKCGLFVEGISRGEDTDLWYKCSLYSPVICSTRVTTIYHRDYSVLTKNKNFNYDWIFLKSELEIRENENIDQERRYSARLFCQNYRISIIKRLIAEANKEKAIEEYKLLSIDLCEELKGDFKKIKLLLLLPRWFSCICLTSLYNLKERNY